MYTALNIHSCIVERNEFSMCRCIYIHPYIQIEPINANRAVNREKEKKKIDRMAGSFSNN